MNQAILAGSFYVLRNNSYRIKLHDVFLKNFPIYGQGRSKKNNLGGGVTNLSRGCAGEGL